MERKLANILGMVLAIWCVVYILHGVEYLGILVAPAQHQAIYLGIVLTITFLTFPAKKETPVPRWFDWVYSFVL
jgi:TRAP-type uncharacterized transport system fused permease subunit